MDRIPDEIIDLLRRFRRFKESGIRGNLTFTNTEAWWLAHYMPWIERRLTSDEAEEREVKASPEYSESQ